MPSDRILRQVQRLLDEVEQHVERGEWDDARAIVDRVLALDPENVEGLEYRAVVDRAAPPQRATRLDPEPGGSPSDAVISEASEEPVVPADADREQDGGEVVAPEVATAAVAEQEDTGGIPPQVRSEASAAAAAATRAGWQSRASSPATWVVLGLCVSLVGMVTNWRSEEAQWRYNELQFRSWSYDLFDRALIEQVIGDEYGTFVWVSEDTAIATLLLLGAMGSAAVWWFRHRVSLRWVVASTGALLGAFALLERNYITEQYDSPGPGLYLLVAGSVMFGIGVLLPRGGAKPIPRRAAPMECVTRSWRVWAPVIGGIAAAAVVGVLALTMLGGDNGTGATSGGGGGGSAGAGGAGSTGSGTADGGVLTPRPGYLSRLATISPAVDDPADIAIVVSEARDGSRTASVVAPSGAQLVMELGDEAAGAAPGAPVHLFHDGFELVAARDTEERTLRLEIHDHVTGDSGAITLTLLSGRALLRIFDSAGALQAVNQQMLEFSDYPELAQFEELFVMSGTGERLVSALAGDARSARGGTTPRQETVTTSLDVAVFNAAGVLVDDDLELELVIEFPLSIVLKDNTPTGVPPFRLSEEMWPDFTTPGRYLGEIETMRPMSGLRVARACAEAADQVALENAWIGRLGTLVGLAPILGDAFSVGIQVAQDMNGAVRGSTAVECIDLGDRVEQLLDQQASVYAQVTASERGHWPERGESVHPDVGARTASEKLAARVFKGGDPAPVFQSLALPDLPDISVADPILVAVGERLTAVATVQNVVGDYTVTWSAAGAANPGGGRA